MAYTTIKSVLGDTNLERKCFFFFGACLLLLISASFWWYGNEADKLVMDQNMRVGRSLAEANLKVEHWKQSEPEDYKKFAADLAEELESEHYTYAPIKAESAEDVYIPANETEWDLLTMWQTVGYETTDLEKLKEVEPFARYVPEKNVYDYYQPFFATSSSCILCHAGPAVTDTIKDLQLGDLIAVVRISFDLTQTEEARAANRAWLLTIAITTVFLSMIMLYVIVRFLIVKPLKHLRDVSDEISHGNTELRADIQTGDEFEQLADAFNRMVRHLVTAQDELRGANKNLDAKVDELAQLNLKLHEMNRLKGDFLATVSHELRTPLNSIIGFSDVLVSIESLSEKQQRYVQNIQRSGRMLLLMINDILDLAKMESGKMEVRPSRFSIDQVVPTQCDLARPLSERKNIDLECKIAENMPELWQDQAKVQQILNNLLSNAIKFTPEGGRITVSAEPGEGGDLRLRVVDTGVGIAPEHQIEIFEKFRQGGSAVQEGDAMTREHTGTGLGLSIVKELCRLLGGEVTLVSEVGRGSEFTVSLPWELNEDLKPSAPSLNEELDELTKVGRTGIAAELESGPIDTQLEQEA